MKGLALFLIPCQRTSGKSSTSVECMARVACLSAEWYSFIRLVITSFSSCYHIHCMIGAKTGIWSNLLNRWTISHSYAIINICIYLMNGNYRILLYTGGMIKHTLATIGNDINRLQVYTISYRCILLSLGRSTPEWGSFTRCVGSNRWIAFGVHLTGTTM